MGRGVYSTFMPVLVEGHPIEVGGRVHQNLGFWSDNVAQGFIH